MTRPPPGKTDNRPAHREGACPCPAQPPAVGPVLTGDPCCSSRGDALGGKVAPEGHLTTREQACPGAQALSVTTADRSRLSPQGSQALASFSPSFIGSLQPTGEIEMHRSAVATTQQTRQDSNCHKHRLANLQMKADPWGEKANAALRSSLKGTWGGGSPG